MKSKEKISKVSEVRKLREAFRIQYNKFADDFDKLGERFKKVAEDADLLLSAVEKIIEWKDQEVKE